MKKVLLACLIVMVMATLVAANAWSFWSDPNLFRQTQPPQQSPSQPSQPSQPVQPSEPSQPVQPVQPDQPGQTPSQPSQPGTPLQPQPRRVPQPSPSLTSAERQLIDMVNRERTDRGLRPLTVDNRLVGVAKAKSHEIASSGIVSHGSRIAFHAALEEAGVSFRRAGENLARATSVARVHNGLMDSPAHRANILSSTYTHIGVGIVQHGVSYYATQVFISR